MNQVDVQFLMGLGGHFTSQGVDQQAAQVRALGPNFHATVRAWDEWPAAAAAALKALPATTRRAIVGYSNGGSEITQAAAQGVPIDLLVAEDATIWLALAPLHRNVKSAISFRNVNPFSSFPPVGHASLSIGAGWDPAKQRLRTIDTWDMHTSVDLDPVIQAVVLASVKALGSDTFAPPISASASPPPPAMPINFTNPGRGDGGSNG